MDQQTDQQPDSQSQNPVSTTPVPQKAGGGKKVWKIVAVVAGVFLLVGGVGAYFWWNSIQEAKEEAARLESEKQELEQQIEDLQELSDLEEEVTPSAEIETESDYEGWLTYVNDVYGYRIMYPSGAGISEAQKDEFSLSQEDQDAGLTFDDVYEEYTGKICVRVKHAPGYVNFSAPENDEGGFPRVICMRSGVGVCEQESDRTEEAMTNTEVTMVIDGETYTANRMETFCPNNTIDYTYTETVSIRLDDGTRIEFGGAVGGESGTTKEEYLAIRDDLVNIVKSYESI